MSCLLDRTFKVIKRVYSTPHRPFNRACPLEYLRVSNTQRRLCKVSGRLAAGCQRSQQGLLPSVTVRPGWPLQLDQSERTWEAFWRWNQWDVGGEGWRKARLIPLLSVWGSTEDGGAVHWAWSTTTQVGFGGKSPVVIIAILFNMLSLSDSEIWEWLWLARSYLHSHLWSCKR